MTEPRHDDTFMITPEGIAALDAEASTDAVATAEARGAWISQHALTNPDKAVCLRVDGPHVGHMAAVTDECRAEIHQDPYDAASEAVGRSGDYQSTPRFPAGTPEYEAYARELKAELGKFARGETPYEHSRETVAEHVQHTCNPRRSGQPLPYGRKAPEGQCPRCDQLRAGAAPRAMPAALSAILARRKDTGGYPITPEINDHFRPGGPHATGTCGPVCTFGDW